MAFESEKEALRAQLCHGAHSIAQAGYVAANDGNLSVRCPDGHLLITPTGVYKGDVTPELLLELTAEGEVVSQGPLGPSSETPMHLALYRAWPDLGGVVHTHSPYALCMASRGKDLTAPITADMVLLLGNVPCLPYLPLGTQVLADGVAQAAGAANGVLLAHHGAVTWGRDLTQAWHRTQALEQYCRQLYLQMALGGPIPVLSREQAEPLIARRRASGDARGGEYRWEETDLSFWK